MNLAALIWRLRLVVLSPSNVTEPISTLFTATALVLDANTNQPVPNVLVSFKVTNGPNAGANGGDVSKAAGTAASAAR